MSDVDTNEYARVDTWAAHLVSMAAPVQLEVCRDSPEAIWAYRLRYEAIMERGWVNPDEFPEQLERDHFDDRAYHILAWEGSRAVGCARLVLPVPGQRLPTEEGFDLTVEPTGKVVDWGRNVVTRAYTGPRHHVFGALLGKCWLEMRRHGYEQVCGNSTAAVIRLYRAVANVTVSIIGPPRIVWGEKRFPIRFDFHVNFGVEKAEY